MPLSKEDTPITWDIQFRNLPTVLRYCKKCGKKSEYICAREFRVNAQQKALDIWLIYKCAHCNTTWNSTIYSRVSPQKLGAALLEQFHSNDKNLVTQYAMNISLLQRNGAEIKIPVFQVIGKDISLEKAVCVKIQSRYVLPLKISSILRLKFGISLRELDALILNGRILSNTGQDLRKCRLTSSEFMIEIVS